MTTLYKPAEISQHNKREDLWMVIHGGVYDLTKFLKEHPGGEEVLLELAGQDGTKCFDEVGHSNEGVLLRESFKIGEVSGNMTNEDASEPKDGKDTTIDDDNWEYNPPVEEKSCATQAVFAIAVIIYGLIFYYMYY